ncbi:MAG: hypothetical protein HY301_04140, partial [Verrucomicrobia bacterium]|nr:hypothetical protein [Verrucomicrobiota bacterium]
MNSTNTPAARFDHTAVWTGSDMIVWAGQGSSGALSNGGRYNLATNGWTAVATNGAPAARYSHTAAWTGSEMIAWGGYSGGTNYFNDGARYSPTNNSWSAVTTNGAPSKRDLHTAVWTGNEMVVWGGNNGTNSYNDGGRYNPASNSWVPTPVSSVPAARSQHTAVWTGSEMIVWGGTLPSSPYTANDGGRYNPANNTWTLIPNTLPNTPSARTGNSAVWTGTEMIVWGGANGTNLNDGGRYNPTSNSWAVVSTNGAPAVRYGHVAVWTGSQMIIWGGATNSTYLESSNYSTIIHNGGVNDGGRYNPAADTWTAVSISNAIPGSVGQTAVWTGSEMIVFGGYFIGLISGGGWFPGGGPYTFLLGGARYNPANDSWSPVNTFGMPGGQVYHTAVWTGSEMIVFGGTGSGNVLFNSGARYNPTTGNWTAMTTDTAPAGRFYHTAVWTGSEMIVWGGQIATSPGIANDGGRYNPANNTWRTVTGSSAPPARYYHTAVWTGGDMLIWGGTTGSGAFNDTWSLT